VALFIDISAVPHYLNKLSIAENLLRVSTKVCELTQRQIAVMAETGDMTFTVVLLLNQPVE
jgi:hypothetical protein